MKATPGSSRTDDRGARWLRFTRSAKRHPLPKSGLDYTDELTGQILAATPKDTVVALVSRSRLHPGRKDDSSAAGNGAAKPLPVAPLGTTRQQPPLGAQALRSRGGTLNARARNRWPGHISDSPDSAAG
jgi:hypothetical protein